MTIANSNRRSLVYGVGINDASYSVKNRVNGKQILCPFYRKWRNMLERCNSDKFQEKRPTYKGCTVCKRWLIFSNFREWMIKQDWEGKQLDKDILIPGNKIYSPNNCVFVGSNINNLLLDHASARGDCPQGVSWHKLCKKYSASISKYGSIHHLGIFDTEDEAESVYLKSKSEYIKEVAMSQSDIKLKNALLRISAELRIH